MQTVRRPRPRARRRPGPDVLGAGKTERPPHRCNMQHAFCNVAGRAGTDQDGRALSLSHRRAQLARRAVQAMLGRAAPLGPRGGGVRAVSPCGAVYKARALPPTERRSCVRALRVLACSPPSPAPSPSSPPLAVHPSEEAPWYAAFWPFLASLHACTHTHACMHACPHISASQGACGALTPLLFLPSSCWHRHCAQSSLPHPGSALSPENAYHALPAAHRGTLDSAFAILDQQLPAGPDSGWTSAGETNGIQLMRKDDADSSGDVPWVRGTGVVEGVTPEQLCWTVNLPSFRRLWDPRLDVGHSVRRYSTSCSEFYTVQKSPSYMVWSRDIVGVQQIRRVPGKEKKDTESDNGDAGDNDGGGGGGGVYQLVQKSISDDDFMSEDASYRAKRTRADLILSSWTFTPMRTESGATATQATYIVRIRLNGWLPTSILSALALEIPLCVGRVRDRVYEMGTVPYFAKVQGTTGEQDADGSLVSAYLPQAVLQSAEFNTAPHQWLATVHIIKATPICICFDPVRQFPDPEVNVSGPAGEGATVQVDKDKQLIIITIVAEAVGKQLDIAIFTK